MTRRASGARVGIAGTGLIGASIGLRARETGDRVVGWDPHAPNLASAHRRGAIEEPVASFRDLADGVDVLVLAAPPDSVSEALALLARDPGTATLVLDVASVKARIARAGRGVRTFVATHPIAGSHASGPGAADARLFEGRSWAYDPGAASASVVSALAFIERMGGVPIAIDPDEHDRIVAATSHLPQLVSAALGARFGEPGRARALDLSGPGLASMLRLAGSSWPLWETILAANAENVARELRSFADVLAGAARALDSDDRAPLAALFRAGAETTAFLGRDDRVAAPVSQTTTLTDERI